MLKITAPISITCGRTIVTSQEAFCERIRGNYSLIDSHITEEEFLHLITSPPELYLMESGDNILNQNIISSRHESNIEVLNQFLNRITVDSEMPFTYQDSVYVTSVLNKLGISDVKNFTSQVRKLKEEAYNTEQLISLYWQNLYELSSLVEEFREESGQGISREETEEQESGSIYLHEEIMNRLKTGVIYQIMQNFQTQQGGSVTDISNTELRMSDHYRMTKNILLNRLKNTVRNESMPLSFFHANTYEENFSFDWDFDEKKTTNIMSASALLQLIDSVYAQKIAKRFFDAPVWMHLENSLYQAAENMFFKLSDEENMFRQEIFFGGTDVYDVNREYREEIRMLHGILGEEEEAAYPAEGRRGEAGLSGRDGRSAAPGRTDAVREYIEREAERTDVTNLQFRENVEGDINLFEENEEAIARELQRIDRQNVENKEVYQRFLNEIRSEGKKRPSAKGTHERMKREGLEALNNPQELLHRYREEQEEAVANTEAAATRAMENLPEDTRRIYGLLDEYMQSRSMPGQEGRAALNDIGTLMRDVEQVRLTRERTKAELEYLERESEAQLSPEAETARRVAEYRFPQQGSRSGKQGYEAAEPLSLVHKSAAESQIDESLLEEIMQRTKSERVRDEITENVIQNVTNQTQNVATQQLTTRQIAESADIAEMIQRGVRRQMGEISEQVYSRIEKKLQNERRRRGI